MFLDYDAKASEPPSLMVSCGRCLRQMQLTSGKGKTTPMAVELLIAAVGMAKKARWDDRRGIRCLQELGTDADADARAGAGAGAQSICARAAADGTA